MTQTRRLSEEPTEEEAMAYLHDGVVVAVLADKWEKLRRWELLRRFGSKFKAPPIIRIIEAPPPQAFYRRIRVPQPPPTCIICDYVGLIKCDARAHGPREPQ